MNTTLSDSLRNRSEQHGLKNTTLSSKKKICQFLLNQLCLGYKLNTQIMSLVNERNSC